MLGIMVIIQRANYCSTHVSVKLLNKFNINKPILNYVDVNL